MKEEKGQKEKNFYYRAVHFFKNVKLYSRNFTNKFSNSSTVG